MYNVWYKTDRGWLAKKFSGKASAWAFIKTLNALEIEVYPDSKDHKAIWTWKK